MSSPPDARSPEELLRRYRASGDVEALRELFDRVSPDLFQVALQLAPDAARAEDALQETWLTALRIVDRFDDSRRVVPWLVGVLRRKLSEARRAERRNAPLTVARPGAAPCPLEDAARAEDAARVRDALDALPERYREVAILRWRYGLEPAEIADACGMPPGTVRSRLHRAVGRLRKCLAALAAFLPGVPETRGLGAVRRNVLLAAAPATALLAAAAVAVSALVTLVAFAGQAPGPAPIETSGLGAAQPVPRDPRCRSRIAPPTLAPPLAAGVGITAPRAQVPRDPEPGVLAHETLRGLVTDLATGEPVPGARVLRCAVAETTRPGWYGSVTGPDGGFEIRHRRDPEDTRHVEVRVAKPGYEIARAVAADGHVLVTLVRRAQDPVPGRVVGAAVDTQGRVLTGRLVIVCHDPMNDYSRQWVTADAGGRFVLEGVPPGPWRFALYGLDAAAVDASVPEAGETAVELRCSAPSLPGEDRTWASKPTRPLLVEGLPDDAHAHLRAELRPRHFFRVAAEGGHARLDDLPLGPWTLVLSRPGQEEARMPLDLVAGDGPQRVEFSGLRDR